MIDTSTEAVENLLDGVTPGPWAVEMDTLFGKDDGYTIDLFEFIPYDTNERRVEDARFITAARDLVPALLAERDALLRENENLRQIEHNVQAVREHEYERAEAALAEVERLKAQTVSVQDAAKVPEVRALLESLRDSRKSTPREVHFARNALIDLAVTEASK